MWRRQSHPPLALVLQLEQGQDDVVGVGLGQQLQDRVHGPLGRGLWDAVHVAINVPHDFRDLRSGREREFVLDAQAQASGDPQPGPHGRAGPHIVCA